MKRAVIITAAICLLYACKKDGTDPAKPTPPDRPAGMLSLIPADSPIVMVSTNAPPPGFTEWLAWGITPAIELLQGKMDQLRAEIAHPVARAILDELDGNLSRVGLETLGFTVEPRFAVYAIGYSLAMRLELADGPRVAALIERIEQASGQSMSSGELAGVRYREFIDDEVAIVVAIVADELVVGVMHQNARQLVLPVLFGKSKPEKSFADTAILAQLGDKYKLLDAYLGYIDAHAVVRMLTGKASQLTRDIAAASSVKLPEYSPVCLEELTGLASVAPRLVFGYRELVEKRMHGLAALELRADLAGELAGLQAPALPLRALGRDRPMFAFGLNAELGKVLAWAKGKVANMAASPYRCEYLDDLNDMVAKLRGDMDQPLPPFVAGFKGAAFSIADFQTSGLMPSGSGYVAIAMDDVMGAIAMLKSMVPIPQLAGVNLSRNGPPVSLPLGLPGLQSIDILIRGDRLGVAAGASMLDKLTAFLAEQVPANTPALLFAYDYVQFMKLAQAGKQGTSSSDEIQLIEMFAGFLGFTTGEFYFTNDGIVMHQIIEAR
ncbi:MAG: hypothetical protein MJE77_24545 [Proteobacteria bacterium]|nr:hypothetical protein [Pseudomonadota bacterium]